MRVFLCLVMSLVCCSSLASQLPPNTGEMSACFAENNKIGWNIPPQLQLVLTCVDARGDVQIEATPVGPVVGFSRYQNESLILIAKKRALGFIVGCELN